MASGIGDASLEAISLANNLGIALDKARAITGEAAAANKPRYSFGLPSPSLPAYSGSGLSFGNNPTGTGHVNNLPDRPRSSGGGASAARNEREAVEELLKAQREQLELLRETDPVQKEMIKNRETLAAATAAERAEVEKLIAERIRETEHMKELEETRDFFAEETFGALDDLIWQSKELNEVVGDLIKSFARAALQAALLGTGPLAGLLGGGGGGGGGFLGGLMKALLPGKADGGMIHGPGSGTSDDVLMFGSSGEFMVNAKATKKHRHQLELMNAGLDIPGFAAGGIIPPAPYLPRRRDDERSRPEGRRDDGRTVQHFHISTPSPKSFAQDRISVIRGARQIVAGSRRYS